MRIVRKEWLKKLTSQAEQRKKFAKYVNETLEQSAKNGETTVTIKAPDNFARELRETLQGLGYEIQYDLSHQMLKVSW